MKTREFHFRDRDFARVRGLIQAHAGIALGPGKVDLVYSRIARRLRARGLRSFEDYLELVTADADEWQEFVNALTTNLTSFFREAHHFSILEEHVLRVQQRSGDPARLWSSACSTGEEPYSMAMTLIDAFASWTPPVKILATDLDTNVLRQAAEGVYPLERVERLPRGILKRFFLRGKSSREGMVRVRPEVRRLVSFRALNLLGGDWPLKARFDAVFCRNVLIYFDKPTQSRLLKRLHPLLCPDGLLFVGHAESLTHVTDIFRLIGRTVYAPVPCK